MSTRGAAAVRRVRLGPGPPGAEGYAPARGAVSAGTSRAEGESAVFSALFPSAEEVVPPAAAGLRAAAGGRCEVPERPATCVLAGHRLGRVGLRPSAPSARGAELLHPPGLEGVGGESAMGLLVGEGVSQSSITATEVELLG